jgi:anti-anti-sigma factor
VQLTSTAFGQVTVVALQGRLDVTTADSLDAALDRFFARGLVRVVLDLAGVDYMSSAGLRVLSTWMRPLREAGGDLRLSSPVPRVIHVLHASGFDRVLGIHSTVDEAIASFGVAT